MVDQIIQPILCCIGHTVAGNAAHFALHKALANSGLDGCVISTDVAPDDFSAALAGIKVMRFSGLAVLPPYRSSCSEFLDQTGPLASTSRRVHAARRDAKQWHGEDLSLHAANDVLSTLVRSSHLSIGVFLRSFHFLHDQMQWSNMVTQPHSLYWVDVDSSTQVKIEKSSSDQDVASASAPTGNEAVDDAPLDGLFLIGTPPSKSSVHAFAKRMKSDAFCLVLEDGETAEPWKEWIQDQGLIELSPLEYSAALHRHIFRYWTGKSLPLTLFRDALDEYYAW